MAPDYKHAVNRRREPPSAPGSWVSFVTGLGIGLMVALSVYLWADQLPRAGRAAPAPGTEAEAGRVPDEPPLATMEAIERAAIPALGAAPPPGAGEAPASVPKPEFDFYKILPEIEVKVPEWETNEAPAETQDKQAAGAYVLQVGSFQNYADADRAKAKLALQGIQAKIQRVVINGHDVWFRVHVGPFREMEKVQEIRAKLLENGMDFILLRIGGAEPT